MINMQMSAKNRINRLGWIAGVGKFRQERLVQFVPGRPRCRLSGADAGVDDNAALGAFHDERLSDTDKTAVFGSEMRAKPSLLQHFLLRKVSKDEVGVPNIVQFNNARNLDIADIPRGRGHSRLLLFVNNVIPRDTGHLVVYWTALQTCCPPLIC